MCSLVIFVFGVGDSSDGHRPVLCGTVENRGSRRGYVRCTLGRTFDWSRHEFENSGSLLEYKTLLGAIVSLAATFIVY